MLYGNAALQETGMPLIHRDPIQQVADRSGHAIIFRAVGTQSTQLLIEGYAAKGFRIDTKSCDWGPIRGFVCVDPRLSKVGGDERGATDNRIYTVEALEGRVRQGAVGGLDPDATGHDIVMLDWMAGCKPVVISGARFTDLRNSGLGGHTDDNGIVHGVSTDKSRRVRFPWALIPSSRCTTTLAYTYECGPIPEGSYGVFVDHTNTEFTFTQYRPSIVHAIRVEGYDAVMGLINPGTDNYGYRACVTGDYDLFAVWAPEKVAGAFVGKVDMDVRIVDRVRRESPGVTAPHNHQHYKLGNITRRLEMIKVLLNSALIGGGSFPGGNLVHHSDEVGNPSPGLKKTLQQSFPLLAFLPEHSWNNFWPRLTQPAVCVKNSMDFYTLVGACSRSGITPDLRPEWGNFASMQY